MWRMRAYFVAAAFAALAVPVNALAQRSNMPTADELLARAQALHGSPELYGVAARLYQRSAALRAPADARGVEALVMAARLQAYTGQYGRARATMEAAAERALVDRDPVAAAFAYVNAAFIAGNYAHDVRALDLVERAIWLAQAPGVDATQRAEVLRRLGDAMAPTGIAISLK